MNALYEQVSNAKQQPAPEFDGLTHDIPEELAPLSAVGDAVADEKDVVPAGGHAFEEALALVVVGAEDRIGVGRQHAPGLTMNDLRDRSKETDHREKRES